MGDGWFKKPLAEANKHLKVKNYVTDVVVGCIMTPVYRDSFPVWRQSFGKVTDIQVFDRILTDNEMIGMTTCGGEKLTGNLINSNKDPHTTYGKWAQSIMIHSEWICPEREFGGFYFNQSHWNTYEAVELCEKFNLKVFTVGSEKDRDNLIFFFSTHDHPYPTLMASTYNSQTR